MEFKINVSRINMLIPVYLVWIIAEITQYDPVVSYYIAWIGSFIIFYITLLSPLKYHSLDRPLIHQIMRPIVLIQLIFAGFMCCTSIFYFIDHLGYKYFTSISTKTFQANEQTLLLAQCQRIALLAHIALVTGIIILIKPFPPVKYRLNRPGSNFLIKACAISYTIGYLFNFLPGLIQFKHGIIYIAISCASYIFTKGILYKNLTYLLFGGFFFGLNIINATLTGYKESIITSIILFSFLVFPYYKKTVLALSIPCIYLLLYTLPTFTTVIRTQSWLAGKPKEAARAQAYQTFFDEENDQKISSNNWDFLTNRFSEIGMFTQYVKQIPEQQAYYGTEIITNSFYALIPRFFWPEKPDTEKTAMERVYQSGIVQRASNVSAKTRPVVDGYLIAGAPGVFICMLLYGLLAQFICNKAESLFGGYQPGCLIIFNSLFQQLWRGNTFEFLLNNMLYGYILMLIIHWLLKRSGLLIISDLKRNYI